MRNRIAAAAAAGILTIGMAVLPSAASASESRTVYGRIGRQHRHQRAD